MHSFKGLGLLDFSCLMCIARSWRTLVASVKALEEDLHRQNAFVEEVSNSAVGLIHAGNMS